LEQLKVPCEVYTRCVGFFRPVQQFNKGKAEEFRLRKTYKLPGGLNEDRTLAESRGSIPEPR
jgi:hypothetical protein